MSRILYIYILTMPFMLSAQHLSGIGERFYTVSIKGELNSKTVDTTISRFDFNYISKLKSDPSAYFDIVGSDFRVRKSLNHGVGLFSNSTYSEGAELATVYLREKHAGKFKFDYRETLLSTFINNSTDPNCIFKIKENTIVLVVAKFIDKDEEITVSYQQLIELFPDDNSIEQQIKYWK